MTETTEENRGKHQVSRIVSIFKRIGYSREPILVTLRYCLVFFAAILGIKDIRIWYQSFSVPYIFKKDFIQEFLISKAVFDGVDPYLPLPVLADKYIGPLPFPVLPHPTPHLPTVALFFLPMGWLSYEHATIVWFFFELLCLSVSVTFLLRWLGVEKRVVLASLSALLILVWTPTFIELLLGQLNALLFVLLLGAWQALRSRKDIQCGILLGSAVAVKLTPWPIIIFLMLRRYWRATCAAVTTLAIANIAVALLIGFDRMTYYYLKIGMSVSSLYHATANNFSLWTIGWRIFDGTRSPVLSDVSAPPLFSAPAIAPFLSIAIPLAMLIFGLIFAFQARTLDTSFGILICLMILVSPIVWDHYLISALIPLVIGVRNLSLLNWPRKETNIALCIGITFLFSVRICLPFLVEKGITGLLGPTVYFTVFVSVLTLLPAMGLIGLLLLLRRLDRIVP